MSKYRKSCFICGRPNSPGRVCVECRARYHATKGLVNPRLCPKCKFPIIEPAETCGICKLEAGIDCTVDPQAR